MQLDDSGRQELGVDARWTWLETALSEKLGEKKKDDEGGEKRPRQEVDMCWGR